MRVCIYACSILLGTVGAQRRKRHDPSQGVANLLGWGAQRPQVTGEQSKTDSDPEHIVMQTLRGAGAQGCDLIWWDMGPARSSSPTREVQGLALGQDELVGNLGLRYRNQRRWKHLLSTHWLTGTVPSFYLIFKTIFRGCCYYSHFIGR